MKKNKSEYLIVINTPFQYLCALEYLYKFNIDTIKCDLILISPLKKTLEQVNHIYSTTKFKFFSSPLIAPSSNIKSFFKTKTLLKNQNPKNLIMGNLLNYWNRYLLSKYNSKNTAVILDDGAVSISIISNRNNNNFKLPLPTKFSKENLFYKIFLNLDSEFKEKLIFYTFFSINRDNSYDKIILNDFRLLKSKQSLNEHEISKEIWFIGSPFIELNIVSKEDYHSILDKVKRYVEQNDLKFIYFPHRIEKFYNDYDIKIIKNKMPFELFYLNSLIKPKAVISFYSTSLLSLSNFGVKSRLFSIKLEEKDRIDKNKIRWNSVDLVYEFILNENNIEFLTLE